MMYGDLAEIPTTQPKRADSAMSDYRKKSDERRLIRKASDESRDTERRSAERKAADQRESSPRRKESYALAIQKPNHTGDVSREEFDFLWNQYQQLSRTMQEALQQRTTELASR